MWEVLDGGRRLVFHLRPDGRFSDGSPITGDDVVRSWLRVIEPDDPSPLAGLFDDVEGAVDYRTGANPDPASVGLRAEGNTVDVRLRRPAAELPAILASPTFAIVPPGVGRDESALEPGDGFVASGAYRLVDAGSDELTLEANEHYWAGPPAIPTVKVLTSLRGASPVAAFENGELDYGSIGDYDASWIRFNRGLGSNLREVGSLTTTYYGFDTRRPPFDDARVRRAFALAVDWERLVRLAGADSEVPATSMVPPGIPSRSDEDFTPAYDPDEARRLLAEAGYPGGAGFPAITMMTTGDTLDEGILTQIRDNLGIELGYETMDFGEYFTRLEEDAPPFWSISWSADYPGPQRLSRPAPRQRPDEQLRRLVERRLRRRDRRGRSGDRRGRGRSGVRPSGAYRPAGSAGHPRQHRHGLGALTPAAARRGPERSRHPAPGGARVGRMTWLGRDLHASARFSYRSCWPRSRWRPQSLRRSRSTSARARPMPSSARRSRSSSRSSWLPRPCGGSNCSSGSRVTRVRACRKCRRAGRSRAGRCASPTTRRGTLYPNTDVVARFRITAEDGSQTLGRRSHSPTSTIASSGAPSTPRRPPGRRSVHWYAGNEAFGRRSLEIARQGIANSETRLGVTERDPIDFYIYGNEDEFYGALGPGSRENVGGVALAEIRTLFAQIGPEEIDDSWVEIVIPHELGHLVFHTAIDNPYHEPPRWLNEGLAVYDSEGYSALDRARVDDAIRAGDLIPLVGLAGLFPTTYEEFRARLRRERIRGRLPRPGPRRRRARPPHPLLPGGDHRRRGVPGGDRHVCRGVRPRLAARPGVTAAPEVRASRRRRDRCRRVGAALPTRRPAEPDAQPGAEPAGCQHDTAFVAFTLGRRVRGTGFRDARGERGRVRGRTDSAPTLALSAAPSATAGAPVTNPTSAGGIDAGTLGVLLAAVAVALAVVGVGLIMANRRTPARR